MNKYITILSLLIGNFLYAQNDYQSLDAMFTALNEKKEFNGVVLVGDQDSILFSNAYGYSNFETKEQMDLNTQFYIASISKQFTATAILLLHQEKKLNINDPVSKYLPAFKFDAISIHNLLSNTSGLPGYIDHFAINWNQRKQATTDDVVHYIYQVDTLSFKPGDQFQYSNSNYVVLAKLVESVSGVSFPSFLNTAIFEPCKLKNTYAASKPFFNNMDKNSAFGYIKEGDAIVINENSNRKYGNRVNYLSGIQGDGSIVTTVLDLYLWHQALMSDRILKDETRGLLFRSNPLNDGSLSNYGYGWYVNEHLVDHTGSWPGYQTRIIRNLQNGKVGITLKNVESYNWSWIGKFDLHIK